jgi:predicted O-methyltransferase YrrM
MIDNLYRFWIRELGNGPRYNRQFVEPRKFSIFKDVESALNPRVVIEVGSWEGASTISWAHHSEIVICIDTWLGSVEHYENAIHFVDASGAYQEIDLSNTEWSRDSLAREDGYPSIYRTFADNIRRYNLQNKVVPITLDSHQAFIILEKAAVKADIVYIDASHDYYAVMNDLVRSYKVLSDDGHVCGDDYGLEVAMAVNEFCRVNEFRVLSKENQFMIFSESDSTFDTFLEIGWR